MYKGLSKREFIKKSTFATCVAWSQLCGLEVISQGMGSLMQNSNNLINIPSTNEHIIEAMYYTSTPKGLKCQLCPNECKIKEGEEGECRTRANNNGILECFAYGNPCAIHIDPIEKKPLYHFLPSSKTYSIATAGCNLACLNCQNWEISQSNPQKTRNFDLPPEEVVNQAIKNNCDSISYTYSDPVAFYEYVLHTAIQAKKQGIKNIAVSAGYIHDTPLKEWCKFIDAANIDLKSFSNEIYEMLNAGTLAPVLNTLKVLKQEGVWLEITNLIVPSWTDNFDMIKQMCDWLCENDFENTPIHFSRFFPQYKLTDLPPTPINTLTKAAEIAVKSGLNFVYIGNAPEVGTTKTSCPKCKTLLIERVGYKAKLNSITGNSCPSCSHIIPGVWK